MTTAINEITQFMTWPIFLFVKQLCFYPNGQSYDDYQKINPKTMRRYIVWLEISDPLFSSVITEGCHCSQN